MDKIREKTLDLVNSFMASEGRLDVNSESKQVSDGVEAGKSTDEFVNDLAVWSIDTVFDKVKVLI